MKNWWWRKAHVGEADSDKKSTSLFIFVTDAISEGIGTPANIGFWVFAVFMWFAIFIINPKLQTQSFMPSWFTSNAFNFPLNTVTTLIELYIGFFCAAATNRAEKHLHAMLVEIRTIAKHTKALHVKMDITIKHVETLVEAIAKKEGIDDVPSKT